MKEKNILVGQANKNSEQLAIHHTALTAFLFENNSPSNVHGKKNASEQRPMFDNSPSQDNVKIFWKVSMIAIPPSGTFILSSVLNPYLEGVEDLSLAPEAVPLADPVEAFQVGRLVDQSVMGLPNQGHPSDLSYAWMEGLPLVGAVPKGVLASVVAFGWSYSSPCYLAAYWKEGWGAWGPSAGELAPYSLALAACLASLAEVACQAACFRHG